MLKVLNVFEEKKNIPSPNYTNNSESFVDWYFRMKLHLRIYLKGIKDSAN